MNVERVHRRDRRAGLAVLWSPGPRLQLVCSAMLLSALAGCVTLPEQPAVSAGDLAWVEAGAGMLPTDGGPLPERPDSLMHVSEEMRRFAERVAGGRNGLEARSKALADALNEQNGLNLQYDAEATLSAEQAFRQRRANCLSYTMLFVALAREVGIPAKFNAVDIPPVWDIGDDKTSLLYLHINARVDVTPFYFQVVDVSGEEYNANFLQNAISDGEAEAQFYNNLAVAYRLQGRNEEALRHQLLALQLAPNTAYLWSNLASLYLHNGNGRAARIAVTRALVLDAASMVSYDTAAQVYEQLGEHRLAGYFHDRAQYFLEQNPYHHYQQALAAWRDHDRRLAYDETRRAIELYPKDARFFYLMAMVLDQMGETRLAEDSRGVAMQLAPDAEQQERYRSKFARLAQQG